ncbi:MAG: hypothetical protein COA38_13370 [Fluviicola sp.]|nr:MAG: hypothetical protein COA38_13370 [Fluviicola sp.]
MKNKYIMSSIVALLASGSLFAQENEFMWANSQGGTTNNDQGRAITVDDNGNVYSTGKFSGTVDFDAGVGVFEMTSSGSGDAYITKTDNDGNFLWAKQLGGTTGADYGTAITADTSGVYIGGVFKGTVDFDVDTTATETFMLTSAGTNIDAFILKMDHSGDFIWATKFGGTGGDAPNDFALDGMGHLYLVGHFNGTSSFGSTTLSSTWINEDGIAAKMDTAGNFIWAIKFGASDQCRLEGLTLDSNGNPIVVGWFENSVDLDPTSGSLVAGSVGDRDILYAKLDTAGNVDWAKTHGSWSSDQGRSVVCDEDDNIYITGQFSATIDFNSSLGTDELTSGGNKDVYIQKLTSTGDFIWAKRIGGTANTFPKDLNIDPFGYLYISGTCVGGLVDYNPGAGVDTTAYFGSQDAFVDKLDLDGNFIWVKAIGSGFGEQIFQSYVDDAGNFYTTGFYKDTIDFDYGVGVTELISLTNGSSTDAFVFKLETTCNTPISSSEDLLSCGAYTWPTNDSTYTASGSYSEVLSSMYGCDSIVTLNLTINYIDITLSQDFDTLTSNATGATYQWLDCDNGNAPIAGATSATYITEANGTFAVIITDGSCTDTSECYTVAGVGLNDLNLINNISFYPVPVSEVLSIKHQDASEMQIKVLDQAGRVLISQRSNQYITKIDLSALANGVYYVSVFENGLSITKKIVKQ